MFYQYDFYNVNNNDNNALLICSPLGLFHYIQSKFLQYFIIKNNTYYGKKVKYPNADLYVNFDLK